MVVMSLEEAYRILGVTKNNSPDEIKTAYKRLALKTHPDKNKSENAHEMFQKVSEAYKRITDPDSFNDEEAELDETDLYRMFQDIFFAEMDNFQGQDGMGMAMMMEMMMAQEMGMAMGLFDDDDDDELDDDELDDEDDEDGGVLFGGDAHSMHALAAMMASMNSNAYADDSDDENDEEGPFDDEMDDISPAELQQLLMAEMMGGSGMYLEDAMFMNAINSMGGPGKFGMGGLGMAMGVGAGRGNHDKRSHGKPAASSKKKAGSVGKEVAEEGWQTDSDTEDSSITHGHKIDASNQSKKSPSANAKKNKRKARNKKLKKAMAKEQTQEEMQMQSSDSKLPPQSSIKTPTGDSTGVPGKAKSVNTIGNDTKLNKSSSTTTNTATTPAPATSTSVVADVDEEMREFMSALHTRKSAGSGVPLSGSSVPVPVPVPLSVSAKGVSPSIGVAASDAQGQNRKLMKDVAKAEMKSAAAAEDTTSYPYNIGDRVQLVGKAKQQGRVSYVGCVHYADGIFVGVVMDKAVGKNNGTIKGKSYFKCAPDHGLMLRLEDIIPA